MKTHPDIEETLRGLAADCLARGRDIGHATELMTNRVLSDDALFRALMAPLVNQACYDILRGIIRQDRRAIWTAQNYSKAGNGERLKSLSRCLMDFPLPGGLKLRDAKYADLERAEEHYRKQSENEAHKARWIGAIKAKLSPSGPNVATKLDEQTLRDLLLKTA